MSGFFAFSSREPLPTLLETPWRRVSGDNPLFTISAYPRPMDRSHSQNADTALMSLEADAASARGGFACLFSSAEEYETALISERRAQGRYDQTRSSGRW